MDASAISEELSALRSIFCAPNELQIKLRGVIIEDEATFESVNNSLGDCEVKLALNDLPCLRGGTTQGGVADVKFTLTHEYPFKPPQMELNCECITKEAVSQITQRTREYMAGQINSGQQYGSMLFDTIEHLKTLLTSEITTLQKHQSTPSEINTLSNKWNGTLVIIDHMRDKTKYLKSLKKWAELDNVFVTVVDFGLHSIYVQLISHDKSGIDDFMKRWRTQCIDVDSRGRDCKEHMLRTVAWSDQITLSSTDLQRTPLLIHTADKSRESAGKYIAKELMHGFSL